MACATVLLSTVAVAGPQALAAPGDPPPDVVRDTAQMAQARIRAWTPPDGSIATAVFSPAVLPENARAVAVVVRQGAPVTISVPGARASRTVVPLTLGMPMPDLVGGTRSTSTQVLVQQALTSVTWVPADAGDGEIVTGQSPSAGALVAFADPVVVSFTRSVPVPNVLGLGVNEARLRVEAAGLLLRSERRTGRVSDQQPVAGTLVPRGSTVTATLETGVTVPNVVGLTVDQARQAVEQAGLVLDAPSDDGKVIGQRPRAGRSVVRGRTVAVTVEPVPGLIVPNVVGLTVADARQALEQAGLRLVAPDTSGRVIAQQPVAGATAIPGSPVAVTIAVPSRPDRALLVAAVVAGLLAVGAAAVMSRRLRRRRWVARHVRVTATSDPGHPRRRDAVATPSWRITVQRDAGPSSTPTARTVTYADTSR